MKAILEFDLPEESDLYQEFMDAKDSARRHRMTLAEIYSIARSELKHGQATPETLTKALEQIRTLAVERTEL